MRLRSGTVGRCDRAPLGRAGRRGPRTRRTIAARVRQAGDFLDARSHPGFVRHKERLKARVRIDLQLALEARQMLLRIFAMPTRRVPIPHRRRIGGTPSRSVANVSPQMTAFGLARAGRQHLDRRVIGVDIRGRQHVFRQGRHQGTEQLARCRRPTASASCGSRSSRHGRRSGTADTTADERRTSSVRSAPGARHRQSSSRSGARAPAPARWTSTSSSASSGGYAGSP